MIGIAWRPALRGMTLLGRGMLVLLAGAATPARLPAQAGEPSSAMPIELHVSPEVTGPTQPVRLTGSTPAISGLANVKLTIEPPEGASSAVTTVVGPEGDYTVTFSGTRATGTYVVTALAPDGKGSATASFRIFDPASAADDVADEAEEMTKVAEQAAATGKSLVASLPASPAKLDLLDSIAGLEQGLAKLPGQVAVIRDFVQHVHALTTRYPDAGPVFEPMVGRLEEWAGLSRAEAVRINEELLKSRAAGVKCEQIDRVTESFKLVSAALNFFQRGDPKSITRAVGVGFANDFALDRMVKEYTPPRLKDDAAYAFVVGQTFKLIPGMENGVVASATALAGFASDLSGFVSQSFFAKYCEKFEGPVAASMHAEFTKNGLRWWTYDVGIQGRLVLRYARNDQPGEAVRVSGELVGTATDFKMQEKAAEVLFPDVMVGKQVVFRKLVTPVGRPYNDVEGKIAASSGPNSFRIPVEGDLLDTRLTLRLGSATHDFDGAVARGMYAIAGPKTLGIPLFTNFTLPYKGAHWIFTRTLVGEQGVGDVAVTIDRAAKTMTIEKTAQSDRPGAGNTAHYTLQLKACNPGC